MARDLALIYLRKSVLVRGAVDLYSEERQKQSCLSIPAIRKWKSEIYTDFTKGHHSGRSGSEPAGVAETGVPTR